MLAMATVADLAPYVENRTEELVGAPVFWQQSQEVYTAIVEGVTDLLLLVGRPTQTVTQTVTLLPNTPWQPMPAGIFIITDMYDQNGRTYQYTVYDFDFTQVSWGCYDDATEVLTDRGWRRFQDLDRTEAIATLSAEGKLEYQIPTAYHAYEYDGDLWQYSSASVDLLVTPNHNLYIAPSSERPYRFRLERAQDIKRKCFNMKKDAEWEGVEQKTICVADKVVDMDLWLEFLGYFISEGSCCAYDFDRASRIQHYKHTTKSGEHKNYTYETKARVQTQRVVAVAQMKPEGVKKIGHCLAKLPFKFRRDVRDWRCQSKALYAELVDLGRSHEKHIPAYVKNLSRRQLTILYKALMLGDGSECEGKATYYTSSARLADDFQELLLKIGMSGDIHVTDRIGQKRGNGVTRYLEFNVGVRRNKQTPRNSRGWMPVMSPYIGTVHCVTVPNHIIYVRRNGKAVWCGNSGWENDISDSISQWAPVGFGMFMIHPAVNTPQQVTVTGIQATPNQTWPYDGTSTIPFEDSMFVAIEMYAAAYLQFKEGSAEFANGVKLYQQYLDIAKRYTQIQDRRDPLIFAPNMGVPTGINPTVKR